jgi:hypothetical protein
MNTGNVQEDSGSAIIVPLFKSKTEYKEYNNCKCTSLLETLGKMY